MTEDLRYALRLLRKSPGYAAVTVLSLALGIGAIATVFSWIQAVLLNPIPGAAEQDRLAVLQSVTPSGEYIDSSYADFRDFRDRARLFEPIAYMERPMSLTNSGAGAGQAAEMAWAQFVSGNYFDVLGVRPALGRFFSAEEKAERAGAAPVVVLAHGFWKRRFAADPRITGKSIELNRRPLTVIGVAAEDFRGSMPGVVFDLWIPVTMQPELNQLRYWLDRRSTRPLHLMARLRPGVTLEQARAEAQSLGEHLTREYPDHNRGVAATVLRLSDSPHGAASVMGLLLQILAGVAGVVLLIVCANVANLMLARTTGRQREIGVRLALGAQRARIVRQLLTESLLLGLCGGAAGILLAFWMTDTLRYLFPVTHVPLGLSWQPDWQTIAFTLSCAVVAGLLCGLAPAWQVSRPALSGTLKETSRSVSAGGRQHRLRGALVVSEVALALVAVIGAGLFAQSFHRARTMHPGFDARNILLVAYSMSASGYDREHGLAFYPRLHERLQALPGVESAAYAERVPLGIEGGSWETLEVEGYAVQPTDNMRIYNNVVSPGYFDTLRIPLREGRDFRESDDGAAPPVMIVNHTFARKFFGPGPALGRRVRFGRRFSTIIGVVGDTKYRSMGEAPQPYFYIPFRQGYGADSGVVMHLRARAGAPERLLPAVRQATREIDPTVPVAVSFPYTEFMGASYFTQRVAAGMMGALGALALVLAALGLYSVMAYAVSQRTHEFGVRVAIGARPGDIVRLVFRQSFRLTALGIALGALAALALARVATSILLGVAPSDPATFAAGALLLVAVAALAAYVPARRATRVDPVVALRWE